MARCAQFGHENLPWRHTRRFELVACGERRVEIPVVRARLLRHPLHRWILRGRPGAREEPASYQQFRPASLLETMTNVRADFIAAGANRRADGDDQIVRTAPEFTGQRA